MNKPDSPFAQAFQDLIINFVNVNSVINLSAIRDPDEIYKKHILDSIELNKVLDLLPNKTLIDIGTGGGFPLLPLAITNPQVHFLGIDSKRKKVDAVNSIIKDCNINNATCMWSRAEDLKKSFDYLTARAVTYIDNLIEISYNLVKKGGFFIFYKMFTEEEASELTKICNQKGLELTTKHFYKLPDDSIQRVIYIIKKL